MRALRRCTAATAVAAAAVLAVPAAAHATTYPGPNGPKDVHGAIEQEYLRLNATPGFTPGQPLTDEIPTSRPGAFNDFTRGAIYWSPSTGAHEVHGSFYGYWAGQRWENGPLGFPVTGEQPASGGVHQAFQGGTLYWSPGTGAHSVSGAFYALWASLGWERSYLGFPTTDELPAAGGVFQRFQGATLYWSPATGAHAVHGAFYGYWAGQGWERGPLGFPTSEEVGTSYGVRQTFSGGSLYWNAATGTVSTSAPAAPVIPGTLPIPGSTRLSGITVSVDAVKRVGAPSSNNSGYRSGDVPVEVDMTVRNDTSGFWSPGVSTTLSSNGTDEPEAFDYPTYLSPFAGPDLGPGQSRSAKLLFSVPDPGDLLVQAGFVVGSEFPQARFSGRV